MGDVVAFGRKPESDAQIDRVVWRCGCGCATHFARLDGELECASCSAVQAGLSGDWRRRVAEPEVDIPAVEPETVYVTDLLASDAACRRVLAAEPSELAAAIVLARDGRVRAWGAGFLDAEQIEWLDRRLADARALIVPASEEDGA